MKYDFSVMALHDIIAGRLAEAGKTDHRTIRAIANKLHELENLTATPGKERASAGSPHCRLQNALAEHGAEGYASFTGKTSKRTKGKVQNTRAAMGVARIIYDSLTPRTK